MAATSSSSVASSSSGTNDGAGKIVAGLDRDSFTRSIPIAALRIPTNRISVLLKRFHG
jgi:hypothetical protein